jgi:hypothetical protein
MKITHFSAGFSLCLILSGLIAFSSAQESPAQSQGNQFAKDSLQRVLKAKNPMAAEFFICAPFLWSDKNGHGAMYPGNAILEKPVEKESYSLYDNLNIRLLEGASYHNGDTVDIIHSYRLMKYLGKTVNLVQRIGVAVITDVRNKKATAQLIVMHDVIKENNRIAPSTARTRQIIDTLLPPERRVEGKVFLKVEATVTPYLYQTVIVDKGTLDGVETGSVFTLYSVGKNGVEKTQAIGIAVCVNETNSSVTIMKLFDTALKEGDKAVLISKAVLRKEGE